MLHKVIVYKCATQECLIKIPMPGSKKIVNAQLQ